MSVYEGMTIEQLHEYIAQFLEVMRLSAEAIQGVEILLKEIFESLDRLDHSAADLFDFISRKG